VTRSCFVERLLSSLLAVMSSPPVAVADDASSREFGIRISNRRRWTIVLLLFVASMINYFDRATLSFALPLISESLRLQPAEKGVLLSAFFWSYAAMQIPMGLLSDRFNLRWIYAGAFTLWSVAQGLTGLATTFAMLIAFRLLLGVGEAIYLPGGSKTVSLLFPSAERGLPVGLFDFGTRTGLIMEGLLVPWMLEHFGWRRTFAIIGFSALVWLVPWLMATTKMRAPPRPTPAEQTASSTPDDASGRYRDLFGVCLAFFCFDYYWYLLVTWLPSYLIEVRHLTMLKAGLYTAAPFAVFGLCQPIGGWIGDRLIHAGWSETLARKSLISVSFLTGLMLIPAAHAGTPLGVLVMLMFGCLVGLSTANQLVILQTCAPMGQIGYWTGIYNLVGNIAGILAPLVTGFLIQWTHSYTPAFIVAAVMIAAGQFSYWFIVGPVRPQRAVIS
jgi:MFS transporter, ACS family, D-galactonate transporter